MDRPALGAGRVDDRPDLGRPDARLRVPGGALHVRQAVGGAARGLQPAGGPHLDHGPRRNADDADRRLHAPRALSAGISRGPADYFAAPMLAATVELYSVL